MAVNDSVNDKSKEDLPNNEAMALLVTASVAAADRSINSADPTAPLTLQDVEILATSVIILQPHDLAWHST
jgi:hypothetical protein